MKKKNIIILSLILLANFLFPLAISAQSSDEGLLSPKALEIQYPVVPQTTLPTTTSTALPEYIKYIYVFAIIGCGIAALVVIVIAGVRYTASGGMPQQMKDAKDQIYSALLGLVILICSWLILNTINPQLTFLKQPDELYVLPDIASGVYVCKERVDIVNFWTTRKEAASQEGEQLKQTVTELNAIINGINENCDILEGQGEMRSEFEGNIKFVYLVPTYKKHQYGVLVYEESGFKGKAKAIYGDTQGGVSQLEEPTEWQASEIKISSAKPFILNFFPDSSWYAELYELVHLNRDDLKGEAGKAKCEPGQGSSKATTTCQLPASKSNSGSSTKIGSIKLEGDMFMIFKKDTNNWTTSSDIDVVSITDTDLYDNVMGTWDESCKEKTAEYPEGKIYPCARSAVLVSANFY